jgi:thiol-disulfide isomerase/thioredoxin
MSRLIKFTALLFLVTLPALAVELRPFDAHSLEKIRQAHAGKPFVLALWSIHCAPCKSELALLKTIQRKFPKVPIILVATDAPEAKAAVIRFLEKEKVEPMETWAFDDEMEERVRYSVDREWQGELPRSYFFNAAHQPTTHSGIVDPAWVEAWMIAQSPAAPAR